ncbi:MAG TPA: hypothetical protein VFB58_00770 [Chloroflexota bacterium]|nr:hypothetical protein [Chloroflexota bacterium]
MMRRRQRSLLVGRSIWVAVALLAVGLSVAGIPARFAALQMVCHAGGACGQFGSPLPRHLVRDLHGMGLSLHVYAAYTIAVEVGASLVSFALGALLAWRVRTGGILFVAVMLVAYGALGTNLPDALAGAHPFWREPVGLLDALALASLTIFFYIFPDGRFVPRWTRFLAALAAVGYAIAFLYPGGVLEPENNQVSLAAELALLLIGVGAQIYRYRAVSGPVERQQTKWVVFGLAVTFSINAAILVIAESIPAGNPLLTMAEDTIFSLCGAVMPLTIAVAILHHRLYDIDALVNRTLVYGSLTVSLAAFYLGSVIALQALFRVLTGQTSDLAIAISTLALAALFNPWRHRLQGFIDRRFYRRKYDAAQILAAFNRHLRDEVDLDHLTDDILALVAETIQPERAALWLPEARS